MDYLAYLPKLSLQLFTVSNIFITDLDLADGTSSALFQPAPRIKELYFLWTWKMSLGEGGIITSIDFSFTKKIRRKSAFASHELKLKSRVDTVGSNWNRFYRRQV
jgi:hypothetical protein